MRRGSPYATQVAFNIIRSGEASHWVQIQISQSDNVLLRKAVSVFYHLMTITRSCWTIVYSRRESGVIRNTQPLPVTLRHHQTSTHILNRFAVNLMSCYVFCCHWPTSQQIRDLFCYSVTDGSFFFFFSGKGGLKLFRSVHIFCFTA